MEIKLKTGRLLTREDVVQTLVIKGGISFAVEKMEDITDETLLSACVQVIDTLAEQQEKLLDDLKAEVALTRQFYNAAQRANIRVCRDENNKIKTGGFEDMMPKYGLTSDEIRAVNVSDAVDREWLKELCWQIAKLRESLPTKANTSNRYGDHEYHTTFK